jgi:hypothetical protein
MKTITYEGIVENGSIVLPAGVTLPEKATVHVVVPGIVEIQNPRTAHIRSPRLVDPAQAVYFQMEVSEAPNDAQL